MTSRANSNRRISGGLRTPGYGEFLPSMELPAPLISDGPRTMGTVEKEIEELRATNKYLLNELKVYSEIDSRGRGGGPGKFREHFTLKSIDANSMRISQLEDELMKLKNREKVSTPMVN